MQTSACWKRMLFCLPPAGIGGCWDAQEWLWQLGAKRKPVLHFPVLSPWANHAELKSSQGLAWKGKTICSGALESDIQHAGLAGFFSFNQHQVDHILRDTNESRISTGSSSQTPLLSSWSLPIPPCPPEGCLSPGCLDCCSRPSGQPAPPCFSWGQLEEAEILFSLSGLSVWLVFFPSLFFC